MPRRAAPRDGPPGRAKPALPRCASTGQDTTHHARACGAGPAMPGLAQARPTRPGADMAHLAMPCLPYHAKTDPALRQLAATRLAKLDHACHAGPSRATPRQGSPSVAMPGLPSLVCPGLTAAGHAAPSQPRQPCRPLPNQALPDIARAYRARLCQPHRAKGRRAALGRARPGRASPSDATPAGTGRAESGLAKRCWATPALPGLAQASGTAPRSAAPARPGVARTNQATPDLTRPCLACPSLPCSSCAERGHACRAVLNLGPTRTCQAEPIPAPPAMLDLAGPRLARPFPRRSAPAGPGLARPPHARLSLDPPRPPSLPGPTPVHFVEQLIAPTARTAAVPEFKPSVGHRVGWVEAGAGPGLYGRCGKPRPALAVGRTCARRQTARPGHRAGGARGGARL